LAPYRPRAEFVTISGWSYGRKGADVLEGK
jgi:hypothetical protein